MDILFHVDSGAGQSLCSCPDAFLSLAACAIQVIGVSGTLPIFGVGTALFVVDDCAGKSAVLLIHNCLLSQVGTFNLVSVSQLQASGSNLVSFDNASPSISLSSSSGSFQLPLTIQDGLYNFSAHPLHLNDERYVTLPRYALTAPGSYVPPTVSHVPPSPSSTAGTWGYRLYVPPSPLHRVLAFPSNTATQFHADLEEFCTGFLAPPAIPPSRQTYNAANPIHMRDLSIRFMGAGDERLRRTLELNRGLAPTTGRVPTLNFPQGKFAQGKTPRVSKQKVHHLHRASICECLFTDTFKSGDHKYGYGQAFVDYRSRYGDVIPLKSRTEVAWALGEFCCRNFVPLILVRDNIGENTGGALMTECHRLNIQNAFICPMTPQQDQAENYLGRITTMASFAMVHAGAPLFFWIWAVRAAVFVNNITATFYSREKVWSTPYTLVYGEPYPDASIVVPFGCAALVLLDKDDRAKFQSRCAVLVFLHYATDHSTYTYAFYSPRTRRVLYRQDCIFLVTTFPMRKAREAAGSSPDGDAFVPVRSPLGSMDDFDNDLSFHGWANGDPLPPHEDHVYGYPLVDPPTLPRAVASETPASWPRRFPYHVAFGPPSTVPVPVPPLFSPQSFPVAPALPIALPADLPYTSSDQDKDMTRGMGNLLREPRYHSVPSTTRSKADTTLTISSPLFTNTRVPPHEGDLPLSPRTLLPEPLPITRVLRDRRPAGTTSVVLPVTKRPTQQRWFYEPRNSSVPPDAEGIALLMLAPASTNEYTSSSVPTPTSVIPGARPQPTDPRPVPDIALSSIGRPAKRVRFDELTVPLPLQRRIEPVLVPRPDWMLENDSHSNHDADCDWARGNQYLFPSLAAYNRTPQAYLDGHSPYDLVYGTSTPGERNPHLLGSRPSVTASQEGRMTGETCVVPTSVGGPDQLQLTLLLGQSSPLPRFDVASAYFPPVDSRISWALGTLLDYPADVGPHLNTKTVRRILGARETIFKYGIYLPRNDRDADASPEKMRWRSGRQLEWLRLKAVGAFEYDWTKDRLLREFPDYPFTDIGHLFYIYDYKFTGEHRVRLVFDGSKQSPATYDDTYSPTVRPESIRLFHVYSVEMGWDIRQYDVPQAFLQSPVDHDIFVFPPRSNFEFPGQILKLRLALYGAKQSSALFFKLLNGFLTSALGFVPSTMDPCFYKRPDALLIVHVDDMRCAGTPAALATIHAALSLRFNITTGDGTRFLGMDTQYDFSAGVLTFGMSTYIQSTMERFTMFDLTLGCPYRELVGCLLWVVLCVMGPELIRVKDLARRSNNPTAEDYQDALKVLHRIHKRRSMVIRFQKGSAGQEYIPAKTRPGSTPLPDPDTIAEVSLCLDEDDSPDFPLLTDSQMHYDIKEDPLPTNPRFTTVAYTDAAFAVGLLKLSISGFTIFVNCTPLMWGSLKQTSIADSSCASEFVAASVCAKQLMHVENMFRFLGFLCPKPYLLYTDSQASLSIATNLNKMGKIRHIAIRYHLVRVMIANGDIHFVFCFTEDMIADLLTKIMSGASYDRLALRFYFLGVYAL